MKIVVLAIIATIGTPVLFFFLRPDLDFVYYLSGDEPTQITAEDFENSILDNVYTSISGTIDAEGSMFRAGFSSEQLVVKLKEYPPSLGIHIKDSRLIGSVRRDYDKFMDTQPDADQFIAAFSDHRSLTEFVNQDSKLLEKNRKFSGRIYWDSEGEFERYSDSKEIRKLAKRFDWLLVSRDKPSVSGLFNSNASIFLIIAGLATFIGIPAILMFAAGSRTSRLEKAASFSPQPDFHDFDSLPEFTKLSRIDELKHWPRLAPRLQQFFESEQGQMVRHDFRMPLWARYIGVILLFIGGLVQLATIVHAKSGLKNIWGAMTLSPFRENKDKETFARLRIIIVSLLLYSTPNESGIRPALALGTFDAHKKFTYDDQTELAYRMSKLGRDGPKNEAEQSLMKILDFSSFFPHRRKAIPIEIAGTPGAHLFHVNIRVEQCKTNLVATYAACVADPEENGEIYQIPWAVVEDLVALNEDD